MARRDSGASPRSTSAFSSTDGLIVGGGVAVAVALAAVAHFGGLPRVQSFVGLIVIMLIAFLLSNNRRAIDRRTVAWGLGLQILFALFVLKTTVGQTIFETLGGVVNRLLEFSVAGSSFVFGPLGDKGVWPRVMTGALGEEGARYGVVFAFQVLPTIIFIAALFAILYYFGIMQLFVRFFAWGMNKFMKASGAEALKYGRQHLHGPVRGAAHGAPLPLEDDRVGVDDGDDRRHGAHLGRHHGGLHPVRHRGQAPADGRDHDRARHDHDGQDVRPRDRQPGDDGDREARREDDRRQRDRRGGPRHVRGHAPGAQCRRDAHLVPRAHRDAQSPCSRLVGRQPAADLRLVFAPVAWAMGVPWQDAPTIGNLLGTRMVLNEFVAYSQLGPLKASLDPRSFTIATFALCGFANFSSIGIQIGGIGALAPERRSDLARLGMRAMLAGTLANFITATIAGFLL